MKKFVLLMLAVLLGYQVTSFAQAVDDRAVVPVSVTLNSILRLNIESGGNVEFNFNTLEQYKNGISGIGTNDQYSTKITIASSVDWDLEMGAEDGSLISTDDTTSGAGSMDLGYITYEVQYTGSDYSTGEITIPTSSGPSELKQISSSTEVIQKGSASNAGDINKNQFRIDWACGSMADNATDNLIGSSLTGGRYSTNVFFKLKPHN